MSTKPIKIAIVTAAVMTMIATGGCTTDTGPKPTLGTTREGPEATQSIDPDGPQAVAYETAVWLFESYFEASQEIRQKPGVPGWESVLVYTSGDVRVNNVYVYSRMEEEGDSQQGRAHLVSMTPISYEEYHGQPSGVALSVCIDSSASSMPGWLGDPSKFRPGQPDRVLLTYTVRAYPQPDGELAWAVESAEIQEGTEC
ncbi:MAG: hypothetical protein FWD11_07810 [Micrococcales bacterium]|nr:hypothetical protein [Micrococcales bacterium]